MKSLSLLILLLFLNVIKANRETVELLQNELKHHLILKPEIDEKFFKDRKVIGDMILDKINLDKKDLASYLKENYPTKLDKYNFIDAIKIMDTVTAHNYMYIFTNWNISLKEYIAIAKKTPNSNFFDLFIVYTEVSVPISTKSKIDDSGSSCLTIFGYEFCKKVVEEKIITPYDFKEALNFDKALKYYSFLKFKEIIDNYIPQIYIHTETDFELLDLLREYQHFNRDITHLRFLSGNTLSNYEYLQQCFNNIYKSLYPHIKGRLVETIDKYSATILSGDYFHTLERSTKLQMIKGIKEEDVKTYLDGLKRRINLPASKYSDFDSVIESLNWSDNLIWYCVDILYSVQQDGKVKYAAILTNKDENSKYTFLISEVQASFTLYDNLIIIGKSSSETGLIFNSHIELKEVSSQLELDADNMIFLMKNLAFKSYAKHFNINIELMK